MHSRLVKLVVCATALFALHPVRATAGDRVLQLRTEEDPEYPADRSLCPPGTNVFLGASVWSFRTRASDGAVMNEESRFLGTATGCGTITSLVPYAQPQAFSIHFDLPDGRYGAAGTCTLTSGNVPVPAVFLVGCALTLAYAPPGVVGGSATSSSVFNPLGVEGFGTGSFWTLRLFTE